MYCILYIQYTNGFKKIGPSYLCESICITFDLCRNEAKVVYRLLNTKLMKTYNFNFMYLIKSCKTTCVCKNTVQIIIK